MPDFLNFIGSWAGLISDVFGGYPLEAAIFTILAYPAFIQLQKHPIVKAENQRATNIFLVFIGWLVGVPILGAILGVFYWVLGGVGNLIGLFTTVYDRFVEQPIFVLGLAVLSCVAYVVLARLRPQSPKPVARGVLVATGFLVATLLLVPLASALFPASSEPPPVAAPPEPSP